MEQKQDIIAIVGLPLQINGILYNTAAVINNGAVKGIVPKTYLPNYKEFYEMRWFSNGSTLNQFINLYADAAACPVTSRQIFQTENYSFGIEICGCVGNHSSNSFLALNGAEILFDMSADNECISKQLCQISSKPAQSARCLSGCIFLPADSVSPLRTLCLQETE